MENAKKRDKGYEQTLAAWIQEQEIYLKDVREAADYAYRSAARTNEIGRINQVQAKLALQTLNDGIERHNKYRKEFGLEPIKLRT